MKKVGILTINDDENYGNRLQNYAVQKKLEDNDMLIETICNQRNNIGLKSIIKKIKKCIKKVINIKKFGRYNQFMEFNKNIKYSNIHIDANHIPNKLAEKYDYFITGSDQVWNPNFGRMSDIDFLTFAPKEKRNSFSASFGISEIPLEMKEYYKQRLEGLNNISVREEAGKKIVEDLTGRKDIQVLVDPTMLLTAEEWDKVSKKPKQLKNDKYILNYFLGELSEIRKKEIDRIAIENNCEVINILDKNSPFYQTGSSEFLYLEKKDIYLVMQKICETKEDKKVLENRHFNNLVKIYAKIYYSADKENIVVKKYVNKCLESIRNQTYKNLEVIVVNDGSTDGSEKICKSFIKKDERFIYYSTANYGVSHARNVGLDKTTGKYVIFIDSDDWLEKDMIEELYKVITENSCDIAICDYFINIKDVQIEHNDLKKISLIKKELCLNFFLIQNYMEATYGIS